MKCRDYLKQITCTFIRIYVIMTVFSVQVDLITTMAFNFTHRSIYFICFIASAIYCYFIKNHFIDGQLLCVKEKGDVIHPQIIYSLKMDFVFWALSLIKNLDLQLINIIAANIQNGFIWKTYCLSQCGCNHNRVTGLSSRQEGNKEGSNHNCLYRLNSFGYMLQCCFLEYICQSKNIRNCRVYFLHRQ